MEETRMDALTLIINEKFPDLILEFIEKNQSTNMAYSVNFHFVEIKYFNDGRCILRGKLDVANKPWGVASIEYDFNEQEFYRVSYSDKTARIRRLHTYTLYVHNTDVVNDLLSFIINYGKRKTLAEITKKDIDNAFCNIDGNSNNDIIYINGIPFINVHMPLDEYAKKIGAIPYSETQIIKIK